MKIIKLHFLSPLHLGYKEGIQESTLHTISSDLLFSVFCNAYRKLYGNRELEDLLDKFNNNPVFKLTSAFPYTPNDLYFPLPIGLNLVSYGFLPKMAKKVKYITQELFFKAITGTLQAKDFYDYEESPIQGLLLRKGDTVTQVFIEREIPRVSLDRITPASNIYYFTELSFAKECGLFFGVKINDSLWPRFQASLRLAADEGIGGDRSVGKGQFQIELAGDINFPVIEQPKSQVLLSRYFPQKDEVPDLDGKFALQKRSGYMYSLNETARRKKSLQMMIEGSVFYHNKPLTGQMVDVTPESFTEHKVYVNGYALAVPSLISKEELHYA